MGCMHDPVKAACDVKGNGVREIARVLGVAVLSDMVRRERLDLG